MKLRMVLWFLLVTLVPGSVISQSVRDLPPIRFEDYRLKNGLRVILHQDKSTPVVAVNVWYHVGSKNEVSGKTGFAHLFEHLMFQGSKNYSGSVRKPLEDAGASRMNGITTSDTTNYFEVVPSNFLQLALFMEADRMGGLLEAISQRKLDVQRDVVKNERRENFDNRPYGTWRERMYESMYPEGHPYSWHSIGSMEDLSAASLDDVKAFFRRYYVPNNAILSIAGDFDERQTKLWVEKYFGVIPRGSDIPRPNLPQPKLKGEIRKTVEDSITVTRSYLAWHGVRKYHPDQAALEMLSKVMNTGRSSRLFGKLVFEKQIAQSVGLFQDNKELAGLMFVTVTPATGKSLEEIEKEVDVEIERLKKEPPTAEEMARALNQIESQKLFDLQTALVKGDMLGEYALFLNKPDFFKADLDRFRKVTAADVQRVAKTYLTADRLVLTYVPRKTPAPAGETAGPRPEPANEESNDELIARQTAKLPKPGPNLRLSLPPIEKAKLSNGLEVWLVQQNKLPIVDLNMVVKSGVVSEPAEQLGIYALTAGLLRAGTKTRSAVDVSNQLQSLGTSVSSFLGWDSTTVEMQTLSKNLEQALEIYSDVIVNPTFPEVEFENSRRRTLEALVQQKSDPRVIANQNYSRIVYGTNPYGRWLIGGEETVKNISREDILDYHRANYRPNNSVLIVVGDVERASLLPRLEKAFESWKPAPMPSTTLAKPGFQSKTTIFLIDRSGSAQSTIRIGSLGAARNSPDYFPMQMLTSMLGWSVNSRISANLRETKGYAYEAGAAVTYHRGAGNFMAWANVQTSVTKESIVEFMKELKGIGGDIPVTEMELESNKQRYIRGFPANFEEVASISGQLSQMVIYGLPDSFLNDVIPGIESVTKADVDRVVSKYLQTDRMAIVIVGDRKVIEAGLKELGYPIVYLDSDGKVVD